MTRLVMCLYFLIQQEDNIDHTYAKCLVVTIIVILFTIA